MTRRSGEHPYRGDDLRARVARLGEEVRQLASRITERYWHELDPGLRTRAMAPGFGSSDLVERERALRSCHEELSQALARAPRVAAWLTALPGTADEGLLGPCWSARETVVMPAAEWASGSRWSNSLEGRIARWVANHDAGATLLRHRGGKLRAQFRALGAPFVLETEAVPWSDDVHFVVATAVARGAPRLGVAPMGWTHALTTVLRLESDALTGDRSFDELFFVTSHDREGIALLDAKVRRALLAMARFAPPELTLGEGRALLRWSYVPSADLLEHALEALAAIRHAKLSIVLVRGEEP